MTETTISIDGMTCQHCVMRVKGAVEGLSGVQESIVEIGKANITFDETKTRKEDIENAIVKAGYKIKN